MKKAPFCFAFLKEKKTMNKLNCFFFFLCFRGKSRFPKKINQNKCDLSQRRKSAFINWFNLVSVFSIKCPIFQKSARIRKWHKMIIIEMKKKLSYSQENHHCKKNTQKNGMMNLDEEKVFLSGTKILA